MVPGDTCQQARLGLAAGKMAAAGLLAGETPVDMAGPGIEFLDYREYMYGDDAKHIDWRASARLGLSQGKLYMRVYRAERKARIAWLVDLSRSMFHLWKPFAAAFLVGVASTLSEKLGDTVQPVFYASSVDSYPPMRPAEAAWLAVRKICEQAGGGRLRIGDAVGLAARAARGKPLIAFTDYGAPVRDYIRLKRAVESAYGWLAVFAVATPGERGVVPPGLVYLYGVERGGGAPVSLEEYARRARRHIRLVREAVGEGRLVEAASPGGKRLSVEAALAYMRWRSRLPVVTR